MRRKLLNKIQTVIQDQLAPKHYFALLASLLCLTLIAPLVDHERWTRVVISVFMLFSILTASFAASKRKHITFASLFLAFIVMLMWIIAFIPQLALFSPVYFKIACFFVTLLFFAFTGSIMWHDILSGSPTANRICGAVCLYILTGFCFAMIHLMIVLANPHAYKDVVGTDTSQLRGNPFNSRGRFPLFVYFSFCTLTTAGYGDIVPVSRLARSFSWLEAVAGQLYLAILVARLVGLHIVSKSSHIDNSN